MDISSLNREELTMLGAGACTMLTLHFSSQLASQHLYYWKNPKQQSAIMIIILMAPIYAVYSFVGVLDLKSSKPFLLLLDLIKESYEALVVVKFLALLYSYVDMDVSKDIVPDGIKGREIRLGFPMTIWQPRAIYMNHQTLKLLKYCTWQFAVTRPTCSILMIGLRLLGMYPSSELKPHKPVAKFSCIIGIIFFGFWQGALIELLVRSGVIKSHHFWLEVEHVGEAIQNVVILVELVLFSVFQQYAFHFESYSGDVQTMLQKGKKKE
ncbi:putative organic solute transporter subunit alpha/Transmembrane protein [Helianthus annuus]|nr:putative organic solute transporter subunit alpha/Transmembrane protein [Helianthus annuus]